MERKFTTINPPFERTTIDSPLEMGKGCVKKPKVSK